MCVHRSDGGAPRTARRVRAAGTAGLAFGALLVAGCGNGGSRPGAPALQGKVYHHSMDQAPSSLDPVQDSNVYSNFVLVNAYDTLYAFKYLARPYELKPNLAEGTANISPDGLTYTIRLKHARFVDDPCFPGGRGREVTARDVIYSLERNFDPAQRPQGAWLWQGRIVGLDEWKDAGSDYRTPVPGLEALDDHTLRIRLKRPYPQLLYTLAEGYSAIVPHEAVEHYGKEFGTHPVGSGPFRVLSYDNSRIVFARNPGYRQEPVDLAAEGYDPATQRQYGIEAIQGRSPPFVDGVIIDFVGDDASRWASFSKGDEIQYTNVPAEQVDEVLASRRPPTLRPELSGRYQMLAGLEAGFVFDAFNMNFPEFGYNPDPAREKRNKALRCAILKSYDIEATNDSWYLGLAQTFPGIIVPAVPEYDPHLPRDSIMPDVAGARRLLAENGWTAENLPVLTYGVSAGVKDRMMFEQFRAWLARIGYPREKIVIRRYATFGDLSRAWRESRLPIVVKGWGLDYPDAENTLQLFYGPNGSPGSNDSNWRNPDYDALYRQASVMLPSPERTALYQRMNRILIDDCVSYPGLSRVRIYLWHRNVIQVPDREITAGYYLKYVDVLPRAGAGG
jgi:oligopeptide transport system substrate-binding protein